MKHQVFWHEGGTWSAYLNSLLNWGDAASDRDFFKKFGGFGMTSMIFRAHHLQIYRAQPKIHSDILIDTWLSKIGKTSLVICHNFYQDSILLASSSSTQIFIDEDGRPTPIPKVEEMKKEIGASGILVNSTVKDRPQHDQLHS